MVVLYQCRNVAHPMRTLQMREFARQPKYDWSNFLRSVQEGESIANGVKGVKQLSTLCTRIAERWSRTYPGRLLATLEEQAEWTRRPDLIKPFVKGPYAGRWRAEWTDSLAVDPNRFALVRWTRFVGWYCIDA